jgi:hypothetical protein
MADGMLVVGHVDTAEPQGAAVAEAMSVVTEADTHRRTHRRRIP